MVFYLGIDHLKNAIDARKGLLAKCLLTVPKQLTNDDIVNGRYRKPWLNAKPDVQFLHEKELRATEDTSSSLFSNKVGTLERFDSGNFEEQQITEAATFDLDCDVVPSSNPSSSESELDQETADIFEETFQKEDLTQFITFEQLKLEPLLSEDLDDGCTKEAKSALVLQKLLARLPLVPVLDHLKEQEGTSPLEEYWNGCDEPITLCEILNKTYDAGIFNERFGKQIADSTTKFQEIEEIVTISSYPEGVKALDVVSDLLASVMVPLAQVPMEKDLSLNKETAVMEQQTAQPSINRLELADFQPIAKDNVCFLEINDAVDEVLDKFCDEALLDSPRELPYEKPLDAWIHFPNVEPVPLPQLKSSISGQRKKAIVDECFAFEYISDEVQAARLKEPTKSNTEANKNRLIAVQDVINMLDLKKNHVICEQTEFKPLMMNSLTESTFELAPLTYAGMVSQLDLCPVEILQKYSQREMNGFFEMDRVEDKDTSSAAAEETFANEVPSEKPVTVDQRFKTSVKFGSSLDSFDPLGDFMVLRSKSVESRTKTAVVEQVVEEADKEAKIVERPQCRTKLHSRRGNKHHVVSIRLNDEFQSIINLLEEAAYPYIHQLQQSGHISPASSFMTLTPDDALFFVRQREILIRDTGKDAFSDPIYKAKVCVYILSKAADYAVNGCLEAAINFLCDIQEEYALVKKSSIVSTLKRLVEKQTEFYQTNTHHPKIAALCRETETWLRKKRAKSKDNEQKILVLVKHDMPSLLTCLKNALGRGNLLIPEILTSYRSEDIIHSLDSHNCIVAQQHYMQETFPWAQFSLVVEYEYQPDSAWQQACLRQYIRHIGIMVQHDPAEKQEAKDWTSENINHQISVIGSQEAVTSNPELLQLLEGRHNMLVIERDYQALPCRGEVLFSDLDVDAYSCIALEKLGDLKDDYGIEKIVRRLVFLCQKYSRCFCIMTLTKLNTGYELPGNIITKLSRLRATIRNMEKNVPDYTLKLLLCTDTSETASLIRVISELCLMEVTTDALTTQQWLDRAWIRQEITKEEQFLLMMPCLSSYSAQLMLRTLTIKQIFKSSREELQLHFPELSSKTIKACASCINSCRGLQLNNKCNFEENMPNDSMPFSSQTIDDIDIRCNVDDNRNNADSSIYNEPIDEDADRNFEIESRNSWSVQMSKDNVHQVFTNSSHNKVQQSAADFALIENETITYTPMFCGHKNRDQDVMSQVQNIPRSGFSDNETGRKRELSESSHKLTAVGKPDESLCTNHEQGPRNVTLASKLSHKKQMISEKHLTSESSTEEYMRNSIYQVSNDGDHNQDNQTRFKYDRHEAQKERPAFANSSYCSENDNDEFPNNVRQDKELQVSKNHNIQRDIFGTNNSYSRSQLQHLRECSEPNPIYAGKVLPVQTFDYNHGLNLKELRPVNYRQPGQQKEYGCKQQILREKMEELSKEFPTAEEIDASVSFDTLDQERLHSLPEQILLQKQHQVGKCWNSDRILQENLNNNTVRELERSKEIIHDDKFLSTMSRNMHTCPKELIISSKDQDEDFHLNLPSKSISDTENNFSFNLNIVKDQYFQLEENASFAASALQAEDDSNLLSGRLYLNPNSKRVSLRPTFICYTKEHERPTESARNFHLMLEEDLRETTRRYLENSQQFSRLSSNQTRRPLQKLSIGLAQPQPRKTQQKAIQKCPTDVTANVVNSASAMTSERLLMEQSMWTSGDSPPMDLEDEECGTQAEQQADKHSYTNREVFVGQPPQKRRKLTYQRTPGKKGQTKLVFK